MTLAVLPKTTVFEEWPRVANARLVPGERRAPSVRVGSFFARFGMAEGTGMIFASAVADCINFCVDSFELSQL